MTYLVSADDIGADQLRGFFERWPKKPSPETHLRLLRASYRVVLALDAATDQVVGYITAVSDGILSAYIPLLEVLPRYRNMGIGRELVQRMLSLLGEFYMVDLVCDRKHQAGYEKLGFRPGSAMMIRRFERQSGKD
ncbi:MAG: GNAT family N-acetyltransferase [Candidatus Zixiibacteriota bacterium]